MIKYETFLGGVRVMLGGKRAGVIQAHSDSGFYYQPVGTKTHGEVFATVAEVKRSLEGEDA